MTENTPAPLTVSFGQIYGAPRTVCIENIYTSQYGDMLYLYDPENPPEDLYEMGDKTLSLTFPEARSLRGKLNAMNLD